MKKIIIILIFVLLLALAAFFAFSHWTNNKDVPTTSSPAIVENKKEDVEPIVKAVQKNYGEGSEKYKYQIQFVYPYFEGQIDKKNLDSINMQIEKKVQVEVDKYIAEARRNKITPIPGYLTGKYEYSIEPDNILSIKIEMEKILSGQSNVQTIQAVWNFDLKSGKEIISSSSE